MCNRVLCEVNLMICMLILNTNNQPIPFPYHPFWHILGDRLIPLAPLSLVGVYMEATKSLTFSKVFPKGPAMPCLVDFPTVV